MLPIPHVSQNPNTLRNDCGQASIGMFVHSFTNLRPTAEQVARETGTADHKTKTFGALQGMGSKYLLSLRLDKNATLAWHKAQLDDGLPTLPLVSYGFIGKEDIPHFVITTGYEPGYIIINDPLQDQGGTPIPEADFDQAISTVSPGNQLANLALVPVGVSLDYPLTLVQVDNIPSYLNVRAAPGLSGQLVGRLYNREYVVEESSAADSYGATWIRIRKSTITGWVCARGHGIQLYRRIAYV